MSTVRIRQRLSVVVPCFNEEEVLDTTYQRLVEALDSLSLDLELIFVDDGSRDSSEAKLHALQARDSRVQVIFLARNFGHQMAATAGIDAARGDAVVLIDADLQDPPEVIPQMVQLWRAGSEVVYGRRTDREGETTFKLMTATLFYRLLNRISETDIPLDVGDFRLMDRKVIDALQQMPEHDRFLRGMISWLGFRQIALPYRREARHAGDSKYRLNKMLRLAIDGLLSFSMKPLQLATTAGIGAIIAALLGMAYVLLAAKLDPAAPIPWVALFSATALKSGVQLVICPH
jgi:dolichol-phosphate mannosyltransferase